MCSFLSLLSAGEDARFSCAADASLSGLTASWLRDNKPLDDKLADRIKVLAKENHFTLELQNCAQADSGQYTCRVTDGKGGTVTSSAHLEVHSRKGGSGSGGVGWKKGIFFFDVQYYSSPGLPPF